MFTVQRGSLKLKGKMKLFHKMKENGKLFFFFNSRKNFFSNTLFIHILGMPIQQTCTNTTIYLVAVYMNNVRQMLVSYLRISGEKSLEPLSLV